MNEERPKRIELSLAACRVLRPIYIDPLANTRADFASKILNKMK